MTSLDAGSTHKDYGTYGGSGVNDGAASEQAMQQSGGAKRAEQKGNY